MGIGDLSIRGAANGAKKRVIAPAGELEEGLTTTERSVYVSARRGHTQPVVGPAVPVPP
jgi:hypothetical protein